MPHSCNFLRKVQTFNVWGHLMMRSWFGPLAAVAAVILSWGPSLANDSNKILEGRIALEKHSDCQAADRLFSSVSDASRSDLVWLYYSSQAKECLGDHFGALKLLERYDTLVPNNDVVRVKLAELAYLSKQAWRRNFCSALKTVLEDYTAMFSSLKGERESAGYEGRETFRSRLTLPQPLYGNEIQPSAELYIHPKDPGKAAFRQVIYHSKTPMLAEIMEALSSDGGVLRTCLGAGFTFEQYGKPKFDLSVLRAVSKATPKAYVYLIIDPIQRPKTPVAITVYVGEVHPDFDK